MQPTTRLMFLFNIRPGEQKLVALMLTLYFFLGIAFVTIETAAYALYIEQFGTQNLPYTYVAIAVGVSLITFLYLKFGERVSLARLLVTCLFILIVVTLALYLSIRATGASWLTFLLPVWSVTIINLGNVVVWTLAGRLFDVRQSKRLFGLIGAGRWLAAMVGGFLVSPLVALMGTLNLMPVAVLGQGIAFAVLLIIMRSYAPHLNENAEQNLLPQTSKPSERLTKNRYILLIFALVSIWVMIYFFMNNIFLGLSAVQYPDADQLASFLGLFTALSGILTLFISAFLTGHVMARYGLRGSMLLTPVMYFITFGVFVLVGLGNGPIVTLFWLSALGKLIDTSLSLTLDSASFRVLYQPLPANQRARAQAVSEGMVEPAAMGAAGLLLLLIINVLNFGVVQQSLLLLLVAVIWIGLVLVLLRRYPSMLNQALAKRRLGETTLVMVDGSSAMLLKQSLSSPYPEAVIYALNLLEQIEDESLEPLLPDLLKHPAADVRQDVLGRLERLEMYSAVSAVQQLLVTETSPVVQEQALRTLAALDAGRAFGQLAAALDDTRLPLRRGAMVGLMRYGGLDGVLLAGQNLIDLAHSADAGERVLAAQILGDVGLHNFYQLLLPLFSDSDVTVRCAALIAAGKLCHPSLWPQVLEALHRPNERTVASMALSAGGDRALPEIRAAFDRADQPRQVFMRLVRICGRMPSQQAIKVLENHLSFPEPDVRNQIIAALIARKYHAPDSPLIHQQLRYETEAAAQWLAAINDLGDNEHLAILVEALKHQLSQSRDRLLLLMSFLYDRDAILRVRDTFNYGSPGQRAYALEMIDTLLPQPAKSYLVPLLDEISPAEQLKRISAIFPQQNLSREQRLQMLLVGRTPWVRACAMYAITRLKLASAIGWINALSELPPGLLGETARWALAQLESGNYPQEYPLSLTTIEKVLILKTVSIFASTPDDVLAEVAGILAEVRLRAGEVLFQKGDLGSSMYIIVTGKVRVHDDSHVLNYWGEREVFGEMVLLDPEPRIASVTAEADTRLFQLAQEPFYELMADQIEIARGIMRVIAGNLRARVQDMNALHMRIAELEQAARVRSVKVPVGG